MQALWRLKLSKFAVVRSVYTAENVGREEKRARKWEG